jgi:hypothetical protein
MTPTMFSCVSCPNEIAVDVDADYNFEDGTYSDCSTILTEGAEKVPATLFASEPEYICASCIALEEAKIREAA